MCLFRVKSGEKVGKKRFLGFSIKFLKPKVPPNSFCICHFRVRNNLTTSNNVISVIAYKPYMFFNQLSSQDSGSLRVRLTRARYFI